VRDVLKAIMDTLMILARHALALKLIRILLAVASLMAQLFRVIAEKATLVHFVIDVQKAFLAIPTNQTANVKAATVILREL
jgi:type III secretory pathway component EscT